MQIKSSSSIFSNEGTAYILILLINDSTHQKTCFLQPEKSFSNGRSSDLASSSRALLKCLTHSMALLYRPLYSRGDCIGFSPISLLILNKNYLKTITKLCSYSYIFFSIIYVYIKYVNRYSKAFDKWRFVDLAYWKLYCHSFRRMGRHI